MRALPYAGLALALLAGCSKPVVGEGRQPSRFYLGVTGEDQSTRLAECTSQALNAVVVFEDGDGESSGVYNERVRWSSDNPSVVFVSDGLTASPAGNVYAAGTVVGLRPGVATVSATYLDFHASISVDVGELDGLHIDSALTDIGEQLDQAFRLKAVLTEGGPETDITGSASWRFDPATAQAYVDAASGQVHANSTTGDTRLRLVARLPECDREVDTRFRVSAVADLSIDYERGDARVLPMGYSESFAVTVGFADPAAPRQDVTTQTTVESIDDDYLASALGQDRYTITARDRSGSGRLTLDLDALGLQVRTKTWEIQDLSLLSIDLTPDDLDLGYPDTGQLQVLGHFDSGLVMAVTRHVSWSTSAPDVATVSSVADTAGEVTVQNLDADVDITARIVVDSQTLDDTVTLHAYANPYAD